MTRPIDPTDAFDEDDDQDLTDIIGSLNDFDADTDTDDAIDADAEDAEYTGPERRETVVDRRYLPGKFERRRGAGIRRPEFNKAAEEGEMSTEQLLFVKAIDAFKRENDRPYPTWTEVLEVIRRVGYRKTMAMDFDMNGAEDWTEAPDTPAFEAYDQDDWKPEAA